jgi:uncharacterized membrane protein YphA (DoxX/SURF4 family)
MKNKLIDNFSRIFVGVLFIFSGLVKINDPVGTQIKLEEYFTVFADSFASFFSVFVPYALPIAMFLIVLELVLGVAVLIQYRMNITATVLLLLMVFFTLLTFYSAYTGKVTDCGCFGDAIPLTPWQSFIKDVVLMVFVLHLFWHRKRLSPLVRPGMGTTLIGLVLIISTGIGWYAIAHLPYIDFRPYKVGNSIPANMIPAEEPIIEYVFVRDGEEVTSRKWLTEEDGYEYVNSYTVNEKESTPKITDYQVVDQEGNDATESTFEGVRLLYIFYNVDEADTDSMEEMARLAREAENMEVLAFTASSGEAFEEFRHRHQLGIPYYFVDGTVLKAMIRANPGIILLKDGVVLGKWHNNDVPTIDQIRGHF